MSRQDGSLHLVFMGVSGTGKSTIGRRVADALDCRFAEGDDFHPRANIEKMASGRPLTDSDRWPWLELLAEWTAEQREAGESTVVACSALRRGYRRILRRPAPDTFFVHLTGYPGLLLDRLQSRGGHFMPSSLLESQLDTLEPLAADEQGITVDVAAPVEECVRQVLDAVRARRRTGEG